MDAPEFAAQKVGGRQAGGLMEPGRKHSGRAQSGGFAGKNDEDGLGDFLGGMGVAGFSQCGGINQIHMPMDQRGKGFLRVLPCIVPQQIHVSCFLHLLINVRPRSKVPFYFCRESHLKRLEFHRQPAHLLSVHPKHPLPRPVMGRLSLPRVPSNLKYENANQSANLVHHVLHHCLRPPPGMVAIRFAG